MKKYSSTLLIIMLIIVSLLFAGCSKNNNNAGSSQASGGNAKTDIVIGFSLETLKDERFIRDRDTFVKKAEELGAKVNVQVADGDDSKQISQIENLISQGVKVLVILPHDAKALAPVVEKAKSEGIKVISYDRLIQNADLDLYITFDNLAIGKIQAEEIVKKVPKGNYVLIEGAETDNNAHIYEEGHMSVLQPLIDKGDIKIVAKQWTANWDPANALANMENALTSNQNKVDAVLAANDGNANAVIQALAAQGLAGKVPVTGQDGILVAAQNIVAGTQFMTVYKPIQKLGTRAAELAVELAKGNEIKTDLKTNTGKMDAKTILIDPIVVTKDNLDATIIADGVFTKDQVYKNAK